MHNSIQTQVFMKIQGTLVDLINKALYSAEIVINQERILSVTPLGLPPFSPYIMPGFIDAHVHIESSMLPPTEFARLAVPHGTVATISDPHEIANVLGIEGVHYMMRNSKQSPFHFFFGASPCVPATEYETSGSSLTSDDIYTLLFRDELKYLSEVMNYPGVLNHDPDLMKKISIARYLGKPIDGHAPGLRGQRVQQYIAEGILTDHECFTLEEALDKVKGGMRILIREGSAAKNFEALHSLIKTHPTQVMFCSDDKHPHDLVKGHINEIVKRAIQQKGYDPLTVFAAASLHPILHYKLDVGLLRAGDKADFILVDDLYKLNVLKTYIGGELVAENGKSLLPHLEAPLINNFNTEPKAASAFALAASSTNPIRIIGAKDGSLVTDTLIEPPHIVHGNYESDPGRDILKLSVINRYKTAPVSVAFIKGFGLKKGAIASSVAHDSHNIICVGVDDRSMRDVVNQLISTKGGIAATDGKKILTLPLPIAGLLSPVDGYELAKEYENVDQFAKSLGSSLEAPFMTLSFMALLVIPSLKLSDQGLFDGVNFNFTSLET